MFNIGDEVETPVLKMPRGTIRAIQHGVINPTRYTVVGETIDGMGKMSFDFTEAALIDVTKITNTLEDWS